MNRKIILVKGYRADLIMKCGNRCCYADNCLDENLEFAHLEQTKLSGMGRGLKERFYDVRNNLDKYTLLCAYHHKIYDSLDESEKPKLLSLKDLLRNIRVDVRHKRLKDLSEKEYLMCKNCRSTSLFIYGYLGNKRRYCQNCGLKEEYINGEWIKIG